MFNNSSLFDIPFIRSGDSVFIMNRPLMDHSLLNNRLDRIERLMLRFDKYSCPFDFLTEFPKWIEWKRREHGNKESTGDIMCSMVHDVERIKAHKIEPPIVVHDSYLHDFGIMHRDNWKNYVGFTNF